MIGGEDGLQVVDVVEFATVNELAAWIDVGGERVAEVVSSTVDAGDAVAFFDAAIAGAPAAEDVEALQSEPHRIKLRVTASAGLFLRVQREQITDGFRAANVRLNGWHARGRWRRRLADESLHDPRAAHDGRGVRAVRTDLENRTLREQAAERTARRQRDLAHRGTRDRREVVVLRETIVGEDEVRHHEHARGQILANHRGEEGARFELHAFHQILIEAILGEEPDIGIIAADVP